MAAKERKEHKMEKLYPIIRRARRPLLPPDDSLAPVTSAAVPSSPPVEPAPADSTPLSAPALVLEPAAPPVRRRRKEKVPDAPQAPAT